MSASGGKAVVRRPDFTSLRLNDRFSLKRSFRMLENHENEGPLSARSGRPEILSRLLFEDMLCPREQTFKMKQGDKCHVEVGTKVGTGGALADLGPARSFRIGILRSQRGHARHERRGLPSSYRPAKRLRLSRRRAWHH